MQDHPGQHPITQHPDFKKLAEKYGWDVDKEQFPEALIAKGHRIREDIAVKAAELKVVEGVILQLGKGKYATEGAACTVVHQSAGQPTFALEASAEEEARKIAGEKFADLFDRTVTHKPCAAFAVVAEKLLTPARAKKLVALCAKAGAAAKTYLKWS